MAITEDLIKLFNDHANNDGGLCPEGILETHGGELCEQVDKVDELFIEEHRWFNLYQYIYYVRSEQRYVAVDAEIASTENQEHDSGLAYEVKPKEVLRTVYTIV